MHVPSCELNFYTHFAFYFLILFLCIFCFLLDFSSKSFGWLHYHLYAVLFFEHIIAESAGRRVQERERGKRRGNSCRTARERNEKVYALFCTKKTFAFPLLWNLSTVRNRGTQKKKRKPEKAKKNMPKSKRANNKLLSAVSLLFFAQLNCKLWWGRRQAPLQIHTHTHTYIEYKENLLLVWATN